MDTDPAPDPDTAMHAAYCGPARGFLICYCECPACKPDGVCACLGCGAWQHRPAAGKISDI